MSLAERDSPVSARGRKEARSAWLWGVVFGFLLLGALVVGSTAILPPAPKEVPPPVAAAVPDTSSPRDLVGSRRTAETQDNLLARAGLPLAARGLRVADVQSKLQYDKKIRDGQVRLVLTSRVGSARVHDAPSGGRLERAIASITIG